MKQVLLLIISTMFLSAIGSSQTLNAQTDGKLSKTDLQGLLVSINKAQSDLAINSNCYYILSTLGSSKKIQKQLRSFLNSKGLSYNKSKSGFSQTSNLIRGILIKADKKNNCIEIYLGSI